MPGGKSGRRMPSQLLRDYRHVAKTGPEAVEGETAQRAALRVVFKKTPMKFLDKLQEMERDFASGADAGPAGAAWDGKSACPVCKRKPPAPDEGTARVLDLLDKKLAELAERTD
jgi:hypothetical protein